MGKGRAIIGSCPRAKGKGGEADHEKRDKQRASFVALVRSDNGRGRDGQGNRVRIPDGNRRCIR